jgi:hypothetical protein
MQWFCSASCSASSCGEVCVGLPEKSPRSAETSNFSRSRMQTLLWHHGNNGFAIYNGRLIDAKKTWSKHWAGSMIGGLTCSSASRIIAKVINAKPEASPSSTSLFPLPLPPRPSSTHPLPPMSLPTWRFGMERLSTSSRSSSSSSTSASASPS